MPTPASEAATPVIRPVLDLSALHLPQALGMSGLAAEPGVVAHDLTVGWLMWVPPDIDAAGPEFRPASPEVLTILRYARRLGCDYVLFDPDGPLNADLPTWDW